jgi:hypothetical protein
MSEYDPDGPEPDFAADDDDEDGADPFGPEGADETEQDDDEDWDG